MTILRVVPILLCMALLVSACHSGSGDSGGSVSAKPNILLVIMDDVGADQLQFMGYGGTPLPTTAPNIDAIAGQGVRFRNTWSMPECSPGRSTLFTGHYPLRNNIYQAIGPNDLANSQVSAYAMTTPKLLHHAGYVSAMFGKFHLAGPDHNPHGYATPRALGWDHFHGWIGGLPGSIDTTAGGIAPEGTYTCGYVPRHNVTNADGSTTPGAYSGACYVPTASGGVTCEVLTSKPPAQGDSAGLQCLTRGGVLAPGASCQSTVPTDIDFDHQNAHYVSPLLMVSKNETGKIAEQPLRDPRGRGYRSTIEADATIHWINSRQPRAEGGHPWMATLSFSAAHTPLQPPPSALVPSGTTSHYIDCSADGSIVNLRKLTNAMIEAMDTELGRVLVATGIARRNAEGKLVYQPDSNTVVIIIGDNGSLGTTVKLPFDPSRAKGTAYQTGVWVPLIVAGPEVVSPDRAVSAMVNTVDVYQLFGEIAGLDVDSLTQGRTDGSPLMPYLRNPAQSPIRQNNFTQGGLNLQANGARNGPCVFPLTIGGVTSRSCSHTPTSKNVCEDNGGTWWGEGADDPSVPRAVIQQGGLQQCWQTNQAVYKYEANHDRQQYEQNRITMLPTRYQAVRDMNYKLVHNQMLDYDIETDGPVQKSIYEFYRINESKDPRKLEIDTANRNLLTGTGDPSSLTEEQSDHYVALNNRLDAILASEVACPGDGNRDGAVNQTDIDNIQSLFDRGWHGSSVYDFNLDGKTNQTDLDTIRGHFGACPR